MCVSECVCVCVWEGEGGEGMIKRKGKADKVGRRKVGLVVYDRKRGTVKALHLLS